MKKIIWGIAAVFGLQIVFQLAMTGQRTDADYAAMRSPLAAAVADSPDTELDPALLDTNVFTGTPQMATAKSPARPAVIHAVVARRTEHPQIKPAISTTAAIKPVVITYDRTGAIAETAAFRDGKKAPAAIQTADRRSFMAKVVTKPYDWLKTIGSKLR